MPIDWNAVKGIASALTVAVALIGYGYTLWNDVGTLKSDVAGLRTAFDNLRCAIEPETIECRFRLAARRNS